VESLNVDTGGSSFQVRYIPFGSLFREPLGTNPNMHPIRF
jgi:hypothetical protein